MYLLANNYQLGRLSMKILIIILKDCENITRVCEFVKNQFYSENMFRVVFELGGLRRITVEVVHLERDIGGLQVKGIRVGLECICKAVIISSADYEDFNNYSRTPWEY